MKIFTAKYGMLSVLAIISISCATEKAQYGKDIKNFNTTQRIKDQDIAHTFYLVGDAGNADKEHTKKILNQFQQKLDSADANSTLLFLGDNIYPSGLPTKDSKNRKLAEEKLDDQIALMKNFKGQGIFVPGNHDWYSKGIIGLKEQQDYVIEKTGNKKAFSPKNSCPLETRKIGKDIALITVDSEWFLADWDKNPGINEKCDIKTREDFFTEFEDQLGKNQNKTIVVAIHHPLIDHGSHGGYYSMEKQIFPLENKFPLPILGTGINLMRATGGITHQDLSNANYRKLANRLLTLIADKNNVIVVSGHDHNLQYIEKGKIRQIISGAGSKSEAAAAISKNDFSYGNNGYAVLKISKSGDAEVSYYGRENEKEKLLFRRSVLQADNYTVKNYEKNFPTTTTTSIYNSKETEKSKLHKFLWGNNYRETYSTPITVPTLDLDTLLGGAKATRAGGGHQTNSLRLDTPKGEYVIRALRKSGVRFLQSVAFKDRYVVDDFEGGFADQFLLDFYTSSNPYTPLAIGALAESIGIKHTDPSLYFVPKQNALGNYNQTFGNELYYLEIRPAETEENPNKILSTEDVIKLLAKDEKYKIDEATYIRARLFDMLIGDWDRHYDQWKWEQKNVGDKIYISPIPKDRDQAFVKYDGLATQMFLNFPGLRHMQSFGPNIKKIKWFNMEPFPLDLAFTNHATEEDWKREADFIKTHLTKTVIDKAFTKLPKEIQNLDVENIKQNLEHRKQNLQKYASDYYKVLRKNVILTGTNKKDKFVITRLPNQETEVKIYRNKQDGEELTFQKNYLKKETSEIWIYSLGDEDELIVNGKQNNPIKLRLLGGLNHDTYKIEKDNRVSIYDYKSKNNTIPANTSAKLTDDYELNEYNYRRLKYSFWSGMPNLDYNPDDEIVLGMTTTFTKKRFKNNPFAAKHSLKTNYFTGSKGYEIAYEGIFPRLVGHWYYGLNTGFTGSHFIRNYFGQGNLTINEEKLYDEDFYRIRAKEFYVKPSINWRKNASWFSASLVYEALKVEPTANRRVNLPGVVDAHLFNTQHFAGLDFEFDFENLNKKVNPSLGMKFKLGFNYRQNLNNSEKKLPSLVTGLGFIHYFTNNEKLILSTYAETKWLLSNHYEFYQMATLGGNNNLRGFRFDRFYGKTSYFQTTDLRLDLGTVKNSFVPINIGIFGGFDYGRVWIPNEITDKWHNSYGLGLWLNALDMLGVEASYFRSSDGGRIAIGFGVDF
ncbi:metallophosphoesterase [Soonwooa purpurea]